MTHPVLLLSLLWAPVLFWVLVRQAQRRKDGGGPRGKGSL